MVTALENMVARMESSTEDDELRSAADRGDPYLPQRLSIFVPPIPVHLEPKQRRIDTGQGRSRSSGRRPSAKNVRRGAPRRPRDQPPVPRRSRSPRPGACSSQTAARSSEQKTSLKPKLSDRLHSVLELLSEDSDESLQNRTRHAAATLRALVAEIKRDTKLAALLSRSRENVATVANLMEEERPAAMRSLALQATCAILRSMTEPSVEKLQSLLPGVIALGVGPTLANRSVTTPRINNETLDRMGVDESVAARLLAELARSLPEDAARECFVEAGGLHALLLLAYEGTTSETRRCARGAVGALKTAELARTDLAAHASPPFLFGNEVYEVLVRTALTEERHKREARSRRLRASANCGPKPAAESAERPTPEELRHRAQEWENNFEREASQRREQARVRRAAKEQRQREEALKQRQQEEDEQRERACAVMAKVKDQQRKRRREEAERKQREEAELAKLESETSERRALAEEARRQWLREKKEAERRAKAAEAEQKAKEELRSKQLLAKMRSELDAAVEQRRAKRGLPGSNKKKGSSTRKKDGVVGAKELRAKFEALCADIAPGD